MKIKVVKKIALISLLLAPALLFISKNFTASFAPSIEKLKASLAIKRFKAIEHVLEGQKVEKEKKGKDVGALRLKIKKLENQITQIKKETSIKEIEDEITKKNADLLELAASIYAKAVPKKEPYAGKNLYVVIQELIKNAREKIKEDTALIIKLKQKIAKTIGGQVDQIKTIGKQIERLTETEQKNIVSLLAKINGLEQKKNKILSSPDIKAKINPLEKEINKHQETIKKSVEGLHPHDQMKIGELENKRAIIKWIYKTIEQPELLRSLKASDIMEGVEL